MILPGTSYADIYAGIEKEREKVDFFMRKETAKAEKYFSRTPPEKAMPRHEYYTNPASQNKYLVGFINEPENNMFFGSNALVVTENNGSRTMYCVREIYILNEKKVKSVLMVYTTHFLVRYRERSGKPNLRSFEDMLTTFLCRNDMKFHQEIPFEKMNIRHRDYTDGTAIMLPDGISLSTKTVEKLPNGKEITVYKNNTFISAPMLKEEQTSAISSNLIEMFSAFQEYLEKQNYLII